MTVREINQVAGSGKPVIAIYLLDGREHQGRIIYARTRQGIVEVQLIGTRRWASLKSDASVWRAK